MRDAFADRPRWGLMILAVVGTLALLLVPWYARPETDSDADRCESLSEVVTSTFSAVPAERVESTTAGGDCSFSSWETLVVSVSGLTPRSPEDFAALRTAGSDLRSHPTFADLRPSYAEDEPYVYLVVDAGPVVLHLYDPELLTDAAAEYLWEAHQDDVHILWDGLRTDVLPGEAESYGMIELHVAGTEPSDPAFVAALETAVDALSTIPADIRSVPVLTMEWQRDATRGGRARLTPLTPTGPRIATASEYGELLALVDGLSADLGRVVRVDGRANEPFVSPSPAWPSDHAWTDEQVAMVEAIETTLTSMGYRVNSMTGEKIFP